MKKLFLLGCSFVLVGCAAGQVSEKGLTDAQKSSIEQQAKSDMDARLAGIFNTENNFKFKVFPKEPTGTSKHVKFTKHEGEDRITYKTKSYQVNGRVSRPVPYNEFYLTPKEFSNLISSASKMASTLKESNVREISKYVRVPFTEATKEDKKSNERDMTTYEFEYELNKKRVEISVTTYKIDPRVQDLTERVESHLSWLNSSVLEEKSREGLWTFTNTPGIQLYVKMEGYEPSDSFPSSLYVTYEYYLEDGTTYIVRLSGDVEVASAYFKIYNEINGVDASKQDSTQFTNYYKGLVPAES